jgi:soluble lytic murein transglycosylase
MALYGRWRVRPVACTADGARPLARGTEDARFLQGRIALWFYNRGAFTESIRQYDAFRARYGDAPEALMQTARAHRQLGDHTRAQQWYSRMVERHPRDARTAEVLWMRAFDAEIEGRMDEALSLYGRIIRDFPGHVRAWEATFRLGLVRYKWGEPVKALEMFRGLREADAPRRLVSAARYWEGRILMLTGDTTGANAAWEGLVRDYPFGFYGHAARRDWLAAGRFPDSLSWSAWRKRAQRDADAAREWILDRAPGARAVPAGFGESVYLPPSRLLEIGLDTLAMLTLRDRVSTDPQNPLLLFDAALFCQRTGFDYEAYRFGLRLMDRLPLSIWTDAPIDVLRLFYPPSYASLAEPEARRAEIPPSLVLALIKQESGFDPLAVSRVGARGLMQLMPATGIEQARKERMRDFHVDSLFDPAVNVRLGVAYLRDVLRRDEGQYHYALAHYNAGPTALARWRPRLEGRPLEESVEDIGYAETREYVKRVMANFWTYQALWEGVGNEE